MPIPSEVIHSSSETAVSASLTLTPVSEAQARRAARPPEQWTSLDLREYVIEEITRIHGPQLPAKAVNDTLEMFCLRFGIQDAVRIPRAAFELYQGWWQGAPVTWRRFAESHDAFFAEVLLDAMT